LRPIPMGMRNMNEIIEDLVAQISSKWRESCQKILETAELINEAQGRLTERQFLDLVSQLPMTQSTVQKLLAIAKHATLDRSLNHLPPHWTTIYEISQLTPAQIDQAIKHGVIHPSAERADIVSFRNSLLDPQNKPAREPSGLGYQLGSLSLPENFDLSKAATLEVELQILLSKYGVILKHDKSKNGVVAIRRKQLAQEMEDWLTARAKNYNTIGFDDDEIQMFEDAFAQICGNTIYHELNDGTYAMQDVRNPKHPYHNWTRMDLYSYAKEHLILTRWSRIREIDKTAWVNQLVKTHCEGTSQHRADAKKKLQRLASRGGAESRPEAVKALQMLVEG
jgi:hypothetical protein